ncbi:MAG: hypothetical protein ACK5JT_22430 [Hyphomicrobiaceae bacterium]
MVRDAQGHDLSEANATAARHLDDAIRAFVLVHGDVLAHLKLAHEQSPRAAMVALTKVWVQILSNDGPTLRLAEQALAEAGSLVMNARERAHHDALRMVLDHGWAQGVAAVDRMLLDYPHDILAHQSALRLDGFLGRFHRGAARSARALPRWSKEMPGWGLLRSLYGFGLEECGDYARAEDVSREAAELEPHGYWPHHAVSHVLEMTDRAREGITWMDEREALWSGKDSGNRVHIWWHKALFHLDIKDGAGALGLYDNKVLPDVRLVGTAMCNPTALLWRLEMSGVAAGARWRPLMEMWQERADGHTSPFNDMHYAMTAAAAGDDKAFDGIVSAMEKSAGPRSALGDTYCNVALPIVRGMGHFRRGQYQDAVDHLLPVCADLWRMGGSHAQRDVVEWTLAEAAVRAGDRNAALALAYERLAAKPHSAVNQGMLKEAEALAA